MSSLQTNEHKSPGNLMPVMCLYLIVKEKRRVTQKKVFLVPPPPPNILHTCISSQKDPLCMFVVLNKDKSEFSKSDFLGKWATATTDH